MSVQTTLRSRIRFCLEGYETLRKFDKWFIGFRKSLRAQDVETVTMLDAVGTVLEDCKQQVAILSETRRRLGLIERNKNPCCGADGLPETIYATWEQST